MQLRLIEEEILASSARSVDIDRGEDPLVSDMAIEDDLHIACPLELLEDDFIHPRARLDEGGRDDSERATTIDIACSPKETLRLVQCIRIDTTREDLTRMRHGHIVGPCESSDRVEEDHHITTMLDETLRLLDHHLGDLSMTISGLIEGRGDDLGRDILLHIGHLFRALIDQEDDQMYIWLVL